MVTHDKANVKAGDWVRVQTPIEIRMAPIGTYVAEGTVWEHEDENVNQANGMYVGDVWLPHESNVILEHRPAGQSVPDRPQTRSVITEFVLLENGEETVWVDPVLEFSEDDTVYRIWSGFSNYWFAKGPGITHLIRVKV